GKIDRSALQIPSESVRVSRVSVPSLLSLNPESKLIEIFKELFDVDTISPSDNFFELGGDSFLMAELLVLIENILGKRITMAEVFEAPRISDLADLVQKQQRLPSNVIPIQPLGSLPPFFCVGAGPLFRPLAKCLGTARPFLGLALTHSAEFRRLTAPH